MRKTDSELGMLQAITRRDFLQSSSLAALGMMLPLGCAPSTNDTHKVSPDVGYPPSKSGLRGSHPGSFETAHALARYGARFDHPTDLDEEYDLVVVGAGISGLTAAYEYRKKFGQESRILLLDNHDDFGGHAKRNEFNQGGDLRLSWGGTMNLEYLSFSDPVLAFLTELGINVERLSEQLDFHYGGDKPAIWFDQETFGKDVLVPGFSMYSRNLDVLSQIDHFPISTAGKEALKDFYSSDSNVFQGMDEQEVQQVLRNTSYTEFLKKFGGLPQDVIELFTKSTDGYWGVQPHSLSATEAMNAWLPGVHRLGSQAGDASGHEESEKVAMFPDGNASIARLLVQALIPDVTSGTSFGATSGAKEGVTAEHIALAKFDYNKLDSPSSPTRLRLESTVVNVANEDDGVSVSYVRDGLTSRVRSKHCVLACYHAIIPHICPEIPEKQQEAARYQEKHPLLVTNVLIRSGQPFTDLGISGAYCPGRMHAKAWMINGVNTAGYEGGRDVSGPIPVMFWGMVEPPRRDVPIHDQIRESRQSMLQMTFEDYEREVRTVLDGLLGPAGFNVAEDILAITVNRWPHGYSYGYLDLWDPDWEDGQAPHEIARRPIGNITMANADAAASAYTQAAIEEAFRAVDELR